MAEDGEECLIVKLGTRAPKKRLWCRDFSPLGRESERNDEPDNVGPLSTPLTSPQR
jgi:hypothetical protein